VQINNGVYKSGFATTQAAYARAQQELYGALDLVEQNLSEHRFLVGDRCSLRAFPANCVCVYTRLEELSL
jgi:putative glutathione S-transferase